MRHPSRRRSRSGAAPAADGTAHVLIISASMGAGHDGAAREMQARLHRSGHEAEVRDLLDAAPLRIGGLVRRIYELELRHAPGAYDRTYRLWYRAPWLCPLVSWLVCALTRRRVLRWVRRTHAQAVVSTYPLATLCLGRLRHLGRLKVPAVNFITDFGVHPLWVHRGVDLNLAVHPAAADVARARTGQPAIACGPLVADAFTRQEARLGRETVRQELGLRRDDRGVLVVAGSWGVGDIEDTLRTVATGPGFVPVVICGRDEATRRRLEQLARDAGIRAVVIGWSDQMPSLMHACDAIVENAGGLTSLEAFRCGLPVVSYQPIAGHGKENTTAMSAAGVSRLAANRDELVASLQLVTEPGPARVDQLAAGERMFVSDGARHVLDAVGPSALAALRRPRRLRVAWASASRTATAVVASAALVWGGLTTGVGFATAFGAGVAHPAQGDIPVAYVGVRLDAQELLDPTVVRQIRAMGATVVVDEVTAFSVPTAIRHLAAEGVDIENGGRGLWFGADGEPTQPALWTRALGDVDAGRAIGVLTGRPLRFFVPGRRINAFDLIDSTHAHDSVVVPDADVVVANPTRDTVPTITPREILLVNGLQATSSSLLTTLRQLEQQLAAAHLIAVPIDALT